MNKAIQYLRGIAAAAVVFKHAAHPGGPLETVLHSGVDLFFVISGFVMVVSTSGREVTAAQFIGKRCRRVLPMWWLTIAIVAILGLGTTGFVGFVQSIFLFPFMVPANGIGHLFWGVGWTLVFEAVFYAYFALGLALGIRNFIFLAIPSVVALGFLMGLSGVPFVAQAMHPLMLEFVMGAFIGKLVMDGVKLPPILVPAGLLLLVSGASLISHDPLHNSISLGLPWALIVAGLVGMRLPEVKAMRLLGDASYSIYLMHYIPIMIAWQFIPEDSFWPFTAAAGIGAGLIAYRYAEAPILKAFQHRTARVALPPGQIAPAGASQPS